MNDKKQIEEMAREIARRDCYLYDKCPKKHKHNCISQDPEIMLESSKNYITIATWLVEADYRNCKNKVVLTREEYDELTLTKQSIFDILEERDDKASKETAKEILDKVSKHYGGAWLVELYKEYGLEVD